MNSHRPKRRTHKPTRYLNTTPSISPEPDFSISPKVVQSLKRPLEAIPAELIPENLQNALPSRAQEIPSYTPPLGYISYEYGRASGPALDELSTFRLLFSDDCIDQIVAATNSTAARHPSTYEHARYRYSTTGIELLHYIGSLFWMGLH